MLQQEVPMTPRDQGSTRPRDYRLERRYQCRRAPYTCRLEIAKLLVRVDQEFVFHPDLE